MGRETKYHITKDGDIYKVNDDGSLTSMGNAEDKKIMPADEPEECKLILKNAGRNKLKLVKALCNYLVYDLKRAKNIVDNAPGCIAPRIPISKGKIIVQELERVGAKVSIASI